MDLSAVLMNYGPAGMLALFIVCMLREFKGFVKDEVDKCESRFNSLWDAYQKLAESIKHEAR